MKRIVTVFALTLALLGARAAQAQQVSFNLSTDTVLALLPGASKYVELQVEPGTYPYTSSFYSYYYYYYPYSCYYTYSSPPYYCSYTSYAQYGLSAYSVTLGFDDAQVQVVSASASAYGGFPDPTVTTAPPPPGAVTLEANGAAYYSVVPVARVRLGLTPGATVGSLVTIQVNHLTSYYNSSPDNLLAGASGVVLRICHASKVWGDLDQNGTVTSRDALITLSSAVGLSIAGFDDTVADIDGDGAVTSRDALLVLTTGIGVDASRAGHGIADACPPRPSAPPLLTRRAPAEATR